jgi:hypothetical protein
MRDRSGFQQEKQCAAVRRTANKEVACLRDY